MRKTTALLFLAIGLASGQASRMSPEQRQAILDYQLTLARSNQLITAMTAMTRYVVSLPDFNERVRKSMSMTPAERLAQVENDPKAMSIIQENHLTAKEYLIGVPALRMALMVAQGGAGNPAIIASPANVAFVKANLSTLKPKMDAADGIPPRK
jgi:hypothetical protein